MEYHADMAAGCEWAFHLFFPVDLWPLTSNEYKSMGASHETEGNHCTEKNRHKPGPSSFRRSSMCLSTSSSAHLTAAATC